MKDNDQLKSTYENSASYLSLILIQFRLVKVVKVNDGNSTISVFPLELPCRSKNSRCLKKFVCLMLRKLEALKTWHLHNINSIQVALLWQNLFILFQIKALRFLKKRAKTKERRKRAFLEMKERKGLSKRF